MKRLSSIGHFMYRSEARGLELRELSPQLERRLWVAFFFAILASSVRPTIEELAPWHRRFLSLIRDGPADNGTELERNGGGEINSGRLDLQGLATGR